MPKIATERRVRHSAEHMFDLVADVEAYPKFVPLCENTVVSGRSDEDGKVVLIVDMTVAYKIVRETFTTRDVLDREALTIDVAYLSGPFRHLDSRWTFTPDGDGGCLVYFSIDYAFRSRVLAALMGAVFERAFRSLAGAFEARADALFGAIVAVK